MRVKEVVIWILTILLVLTFANAGIRKFFEHGGWTQAFHNLGLPDWFRLLIGVIETAAALLLLYPRTAAYGALMNIVVMIGAITMLIVHHWLRGLPVAIIALVASAIVLAARWRGRYAAAS